MRPPRWLAAALLSVVTALPAAAQALFEDDFESGLGAWTVTSLSGDPTWRQELDADACGSTLVPFPSGTAVARYGLAASCDYANFTPGVATLASPLLALPAADRLRRPELRFRYHFHSRDPDECYDLARVSVQGQQLDEWCSGSFAPYPWETTWGAARYDLTALAGQSVAVQFEMYHDEFFSQGAGFAVDDVWVGMVTGTYFCEALDKLSDSRCSVCETPSLLLGHFQDNGGCRNRRGFRPDVFASGVPSVSADSVTLHTSGLPLATTALLIQGASREAYAFGDGLMCLEVPIARLAFRQALQGRVDYPGPDQPPLSVLGAVAGGETVGYQVYYRDNAPTHCTPARFNLSNGVELTWAP